MKHWRIKMWVTGLAGLAVAGILWPGGPAQAQPALMGTAKNFNMSEYYPAPYETRMKSLISGKEAQPQADGRYFIKGLRLETYDEKGARQSVVIAPECVYDGTKRVASSPGRLRVETSEGNFIVEGEGFLWRQDESQLYISNRVHTTVYNSGVMSK